jgi:hypothetical protein
MKNIIVIVVTAVIAAVILESFTSLALTMSLLFGVVAGIAAAVVLLSMSRGENPKAVAEEVVRTAKAVVTEPPSTFQERAASEQLFRMLEQLTLSGVAPAVVPSLKQVVGKLREAVSRALEFSEHSETTFNLVKLAKEDLPSQVTAFITLSDTDRASKQDGFISQLFALSSKIDELLGLINAGQADAFAAQSEFVATKFDI